MKRCNGSGCIRKLKGNRSKPYQVLVTTSYNSKTKKQCFKSVGTFKTRFDAEYALHCYINDKDSMNNKKHITIKDIYDVWSSSKYKNLANNSIMHYKTAFNIMTNIHDIDICDISLKMLQDECNLLTPQKQRQFKKLLHMLLDYAVANDYISKNYSDYLILDKLKPNNKNLFTIEEIKNIVTSDDKLLHQILKILLYTGLRINELLNLKVSDVDLVSNIIDIKSSKTKSGIRKIPIHNCILDLVTDLCSKSNTYLFIHNNKKLPYSTLRSKLKKEFKNHIFHECRHTFISQCKKCNLDSYAIKLIVGHATSDITLSVYTHVDISYLESELSKFKYF